MSYKCCGGSAALSCRCNDTDLLAADLLEPLTFTLTFGRGAITFSA